MVFGNLSVLAKNCSSSPLHTRASLQKYSGGEMAGQRLMDISSVVLVIILMPGLYLVITEFGFLYVEGNSIDDS